MFKYRKKMKNIIQAIALLAIATTAFPSYAAHKLNIPIEQTPCKTITLPDGSKACEPPKVSQASSGCIRVTVTQGGKFVKYIWVCEKPRTPKAEKPKPANEKPKGGY